MGLTMKRLTGDEAREDSGQGATHQHELTIFTVVKPFEGLADLHQRNALQSWIQLGRDVRIVLFHGEPLPADIAQDFETVPIELRNQFGTPLLNDVFKRASEIASSALLAYVNADIMIGDDFLPAIRQLDQSELGSWLAIGRRMDADIGHPIDCCKNPNWKEQLLDQSDVSIRRASIVCKDYFVFQRGLFQEIPAFAVGRGNWDNWIVASAKTAKLPVVDLSESVIVIHQNHDYSHVRGGRLAAYVNGPEARENQRLAGGRNLIRGSTPTWVLTPNGLQPAAKANWTFCRDALNFCRLMRNLLFFR